MEPGAARGWPPAGSADVTLGAAMEPTPYRNEDAVMNLAQIAHPAAILLAKSGGITLDPIAKPIAAVLAFFYSLVPNYAAAIILLTVSVMIILTPLTIKQTRSMLVMQKLQPEMKRLQEEHKNDRQALNEAVMALYKEHNASPLGGCLPMLLPFPVFIALFRVLEGLSRMSTVSGKLVSNPKYLTQSTRMYQDIKRQGGTLKAFGMDLSKSALNFKGRFWASLPFFILLLLMVGTQYYQQRQLTSRNPQAAQGQQAQIMKFFPLIFGVISIRFPAGVVLYWTVSNAIRIFQQWAMYRFDPKVKALVEADIKEVEAKTREIGARPPTPRPRLRDLLSGAANPPTDPKASAKPNRSGGGGKPSGAKPTGAKPTGAKPNGAKGSGAKPTGVKPVAGKPSSGKAIPSARKPQPVAGRPAEPAASKPPAADAKSPATSPPADKAQSPPNNTTPRTVRRRPGADDTPPDTEPGSHGTPRSDNGGSSSGTPTDPSADAPDEVSAPRGRTGAGGARAGGNRGKRTRRGR
jgi:YidC/Oxa1 family membrane protein insertase